MSTIRISMLFHTILFILIVILLTIRGIEWRVDQILLFILLYIGMCAAHMEFEHNDNDLYDNNECDDE